ncbi:MAG: hypothetical protein Q7S27_03735 [Nanoarchaeota archaeon]|nr:hypothetical protein [Nanoarchaeota archaeon]
MARKMLFLMLIIGIMLIGYFIIFELFINNESFPIIGGDVGDDGTGHYYFVCEQNSSGEKIYYKEVWGRGPDSAFVSLYNSKGELIEIGQIGMGGTFKFNLDSLDCIRTTQEYFRTKVKID